MSFKVSFEKRLDVQVLKNIAAEHPNLVAITDFGSGYLNLINDILRDMEVIILDHHTVIGEAKDNIFHQNPLIYKIDGSREIAAAGVCYFFAKMVDFENIDSASIAIVGALGDQQNKGDKGSLIGANTIIQKEAEESGQLKREIGLTFYGYETRPLAKAISYTTNPFIPGLSGREDNCVAFLTHLGIRLKLNGRLRSISDLDEDEQRKIYSALSSHMLSQGNSTKSIHELIGWIYKLPKEPKSTSLRDGKEYSSLLNACARMRKPSIGFGIILGDRSNALREAEDTVEEYRKVIGSYLEWVQKGEKIREMETIYVLNAGQDIDENIIGVVAGIILAQGTLKRSKPIISFAFSEDGTVKFSARGTDEILINKLHLGKVMQEAAESFNGGGGGHDIAAGAYIPQGFENEFIQKVNDIVKRRV
jgi:RecJ-like exonuclease